jgi:hypothetical protein
MGSDTLSGTPGNQKAVAIGEIGTTPFNSAWEVGAPGAGNGVMWLMSTTYQADQPSNLAFSFFYNFINTGPAVTGATMSCGVDNCGYIVLNGVKYPSTNVNLSIGYEGIVTTASFTVTVPTGLNTLELRVVNQSGTSGNSVWENQGLTGGPTGAWMIIKSSTGTLLVKTNATWNCTQFNYPAKFIGPVSLGDVAENAGLSRPYSLAALSGKTMLDNSMNATTLAYPVSLYTAISKTFLYPAMPTAESITFNQGGYVFYNNTASGVVQQPSISVLTPESRNYAATSLYVQNNMNLTQLQNYPQDDKSLATLFITDWGTPSTKGWYTFRGRTVFGRYIGGGSHWWSISWIIKP